MLEDLAALVACCWRLGSLLPSIPITLLLWRQVRPLVLLQVVPLAEALAALFANERLYPSVDPLVSDKVGSRGGGLTADTAREGVLSRVLPRVDLKGLLPLE